MAQRNNWVRSPWTWVPSLYFAEGVPYVVVMAIAAVMYKRFGLSNTDIALYTSWLYLPWVIKPFWSPIVDMLKTKRWWIVSMQLLVGAALAGVAFTLQTSFAIQLSLAFFWLMAFSSATHDIAADGFYMLGLDDEEQALFVGIRSTFYRIATIAGQGFLIMIAGVLEVFTRRISMAWSLTFYAAAALFLLLCVYHKFMLPHPKEDHLKTISGRHLLKDFVGSFVTFFQKQHIALVLVAAAVMCRLIGLSNMNIALYVSWLYLSWAISALCIPIVDILKNKRWWMVIISLLTVFALAAVAFTLHIAFLLQLSLAFFWLTAFVYAYNDSIDRSYLLDYSHMRRFLFLKGKNIYNHIIMIIGQFFLIMISVTGLDAFTRHISIARSITLYIIVLFLLLCVYHKLMMPHLCEDNSRDSSEPSLLRDFVSSFVTFFQKPHIVPAVLFMLLYRFPEAMLTRICPLFFIEKKSAMGLGLTTSELGFVQGTIGVIGLTIGGIIGGVAAAKGGLRRWLWPMVVAMSLPNVVYVYLSLALPDNFFIINACVFVEQFGYGFGFTAYMLFLILFSKGNNKTAHYAICTAFMAMSMMFPGMAAGWLQERLGYSHFFEMIMLLCLITVGVSWWVKRHFETLR